MSSIEYKVHPIAERFPLIEGEAFAELVTSIKQNGQRDSIILTPDGTMVVDGRNRLRACLEAGLEPHFRKLSDDYDDAAIVRYIVDINLRRRDLTPGQKAMLALDVEAYLAEEAKKRRLANLKQNTEVADLPPREREELALADAADFSSPGKSRDQAAKVTGASGKGVQMAKKVAAAAPDLKEKVMAGSMSLDAAYKQVRKAEEPPENPLPRIHDRMQDLWMEVSDDGRKLFLKVANEGEDLLEDLLRLWLKVVGDDRKRFLAYTDRIGDV